MVVDGEQQGDDGPQATHALNPDPNQHSNPQGSGNCLCRMVVVLAEHDKEMLDRKRHTPLTLIQTNTRTLKGQEPARAGRWWCWQSITRS